jgi:hypothetical protein
VKIIQYNSGARSDLERNLMSDETLITLIFQPPERHPRNAAVSFSWQNFNWAAGSTFFYRRPELEAAQKPKSKKFTTALPDADW